MKKAAITTGAAIAAATGIFFMSNAPNMPAENRVVVRFYDGTSGPPAGWPASAQPVNTTEVLDGWDANMSVTEYKAYRAQRQADYNAWEEAQRAGEKTQKELDKEKLKDTISIQTALAQPDLAVYVGSLSSSEFDELLRDLVIQELATRRINR